MVNYTSEKPASGATLGDARRIRVLARDVSLAREAPVRSSILNVLPARIVSKKDLDAYDDLVVIALGDQPGGARLL